MAFKNIDRKEMINKVIGKVFVESYEYESSGIISALFESEICPTDKFQQRLSKEKEKPFFSNSNSYMKRI